MLKILNFLFSIKPFVIDVKYFGKYSFSLFCKIYPREKVRIKPKYCMRK